MMMCFVHVLFASLMMSAVGGRQADVARQNRAADQHNMPATDTSRERRVTLTA